jgi:hypothetical protein
MRLTGFSHNSFHTKAVYRCTFMYLKQVVLKTSFNDYEAGHREAHLRTPNYEHEERLAG